MATVKWNQIGALNKQLILDLRDGKARSSDYPLDKEPPDGWLHSGFDYDIKDYGLYGYTQKKKLSAEWGGVKYYAFKASGIDMKIRIVHIYKKGEGSSKSDHRFYRLVHTEGRPGAYTNDYQSCEEIIDIGAS
ncbi:hypothetical protein GCM10025771_42100 [Niveibacterium umoris]|uniref:Uncharacterized protein n=1 Tax=Niveibacterium umoris TaxID=1193620 RepID=A0A840BP71_9RHOO|nr:hypothetical protein [Niveibacterium umoris]MBB4014790.1 hypothetical protein [Niveibacterium umoris]